MDPLVYQPPPHPPGFQPRMGRLISAGILLILGACACGCMTATLPLALLAPQPQSNAQTRQLIVVGGLYLAITAALGTLGIGAILPRRWARPLTIILATHWLILGAVTVVAMIVMLPLLGDSIAAAGSAGGGGPPPGLLTGILGITIVLMAVVTVGWPAALLLLLRGDEVRQTCEWKDPKTRWTDRCPVNVLGLAITLALAGAFAMFAGFQKTLPIMGVMLVQPTAFSVAAAVAAVLFIAAVKSYRVQMAGWWMGLGGVVLPLLAYIPNGNLPLDEVYRAAGMQEKQLAPILQHADAMRGMMITFPLIFALAFFLYMLRLRPAFIKHREAIPASQQSS